MEESLFGLSKERMSMTPLCAAVPASNSPGSTSIPVKMAASSSPLQRESISWFKFIFSEERMIRPPLCSAARLPVARTPLVTGRSTIWVRCLRDCCPSHSSTHALYSKQRNIPLDYEKTPSAPPQKRCRSNRSSSSKYESGALRGPRAVLPLLLHRGATFPNSPSRLGVLL